MHPSLCLRRGLFGTIAQTNHQQGIGKAGDPKANPALGFRFTTLRFQWETAGIDNIVHHPNRSRDQIGHACFVQIRTFGKRLRHQTRHINRPKQTRTIGRQRLLTARIGCGNGFAIAQVVGFIDPVNENYTRFGKFKCRAHDLIPQIHGFHGLKHFAFKHQIPRAIGLHGIHKGIRYQNRDVEHSQTGWIAFSSDEIQYIRVVTAHCGHHCTTTAAC